MAKSTRAKASKIKTIPRSEKQVKPKDRLLRGGGAVSAAVRIGNDNLKPGREQADFRSRNQQSTNAIPDIAGINLLYWMVDKQHDSKQPISEFDILTIGHEGISKLSFDRLAIFLGVSRKSMAEDIFNISVKTFERKDPKGKMDKKTSSHAVEIARVMQHASEVFEDDNKVRRWIHKENRALNNMKPIELFDTLTGLNMVNDILGRIEEGVYS